MDIANGCGQDHYLQDEPQPGVFALHAPEISASCVTLAVFQRGVKSVTYTARGILALRKREPLTRNRGGTGARLRRRRLTVAVWALII